MFGHDPELTRELYAAYAAKGDEYEPRTRHLDEGRRPVYINRLIFEDTPYLLQHAHNPVDWHPWGREALNRAKTEDKPVFLSIGYSTCHWCHVMEVESFDDVSVARYMNEHFIAIKVDRELLPEVDAVYMAAAMMINGQGGWPMSSFLTADGRPFFAGTYYPPQQFLSLLQGVRAAWDQRRADLLEQAELITDRINQATSVGRQAAGIDNGTIARAVDEIVRSFDGSFGGFGGAPKFPNEPYLFLLAEAAVHFDAVDAAPIPEVLDKTLKAMAQGGIYDHVGGGFHRYSVDQHWLVPHFEKMLYNQANLARVYLRVYQITGAEWCGRVVTEILDYVVREMRDAGGGFYSATDADSEDREGVFFSWTREELRSRLGEEEYLLAVDLFGVTEAGNFDGRSILYLAEGYAEYAQNHGLAPDGLLETVATIKQKLLHARNERVRPLRDDKIITAWNGMMITAFSDAGKTLGREDYTRAAVNAANYLLQKNRRRDGGLWRASLNGRPAVVGTQEDYAFLAEGLVQLYDDTDDDDWLRQAQALIDTMVGRFSDRRDGGFYMTEEDAAVQLPLRMKELDDNAVPSGNSTALRVLARLAKRTGREDYRGHAERLIGGFCVRIARYPHAFSYLQTGLLEFLNHECGARQYAAGGNIRIDSAVSGEGRELELIVRIAMRPQWRIHAGGGAGGDLIATELVADERSSWELAEVNYPEPVIEAPSSLTGALPVYRDEVVISAVLKGRGARNGGSLIRFKLRLQACNDDACLAPETVAILVSGAVG